MTIRYGDKVYTTESIRGATGAQGERGATGAPGIGIEQTIFNDDYTLTILFNDGSYFTTPSLRGATGADGKGFKILGYYQSASALSNSVQNPSAGDAYGVGSGEPYDIYIWDAVNAKWVNNGVLQGATGKDGTTFTPSVSADGVLSWSNDDGKQNPPSVSIKGPPGAAGKDPEPFYVNCTVAGPNIYDEEVTHDKTYAQILTAHQAGRPCYAVVNFSNNDKCYLPLTRLTEGTDAMATFSLTQIVTGDASEELQVFYVSISPNYAEGFQGSRYTAGVNTQFLPAVSASDNGKFLQVVKGAWAAVKIPDAEGGSY